MQLKIYNTNLQLDALYLCAIGNRAIKLNISDTTEQFSKADNIREVSWIVNPQNESAAFSRAFVTQKFDL